MTETPLVTVIVPTHSHSETLSYSVQSICDQSISSIAIVIIGDGVTDDVRRVAHQLCASDARISFIDHPKTPRRGELLRDKVIRECKSTYIAYNCDDDLWFPHHLETLLTVIKDTHFAHPLPILIGADGVPFFMPSDLSRRESVDWHLSDIPRNTISLSGVLHTREAYLRLPYGWRETPAGRWTDHYMWQQFFEQEWFRGVTSPHASTLKLMAQGRDDLTSEERLKDIEHWWRRLHSREFQSEWNEMVRDAMWKSAVDHVLVSTWREDEITHLRTHISSLELEQAQLHATFHEMNMNASRIEQENQQLSAQLTNMERRLRNLRERLDSRRLELENIQASTSWKITKPLRAVRKLFR